ncbi:hypothetical protein T040910_197 [Synechococcus phage S-CAM3]|uniref:Plasmid stability protein n=1 Tax=Synechococcus phage S-CAM3 TaxID=1883366 RepID=A0A1D8KJX1_9CAUD|nr:plasmid stability [Synechococcus phage S-CAM3]AOV58701.1 hypothetical protein S250808_196 [Synechococcus phage S-CAM3]AOV58941.1 hypothetical protein T040910_197 [Synechococcus phage S-CAM3]AOV59180.1 hypothetical protein C421010_197 [Synechococcus phage S-CAM3]
MQKIINIVALLSGLTSLGVIGGGVFVYLQKDALLQQGIDALSAGAIESITDAVPGILDAGMPEPPELPKHTGGVLPGM